MEEMRKERDIIMNDIMSNNPSLCEEEIFEKYIDVCVKVYKKYKELINNFDVSKLIDYSQMGE